MIGKPPSKKTIQAMKIALNTAAAKQDDKAVALKLWRDLRWRLKVLDGDYSDVISLISEFCERAKSELKSEETREAVLSRLTEMGMRLSEFNVEPEEE